MKDYHINVFYSEEDEGYSPLLVEQRIIRRVFKLSHHDDCRIITHLHYKNWPDHGAPDPALFHRFLALLDDAHPGSSYPIFVHCAAGIGRSGTFVAAHSLRKEVLMHRASDGPLSINIAKRILEMRMQRYKLLSRPTQLRAVIEAVRDAIQQRAQ